MGTFLTRGQPTALAAVERAVTRESAPHALMLVGPARVGKTTLALDLTAGLLCLAVEPAARPCRACAACRKVVHGNHPDLHRLAPEGAGEQIRLAAVQALISSLALLPMEGRVRVAIVEAAHRLNPDAQNALLKTLEEPPAGVCLILVVDDEPLILPTVRSRCARVRLGPLPAAAIADLLSERGVADPARGSALARLSGGRPGLAMALALGSDSTLVHDRLVRSLLDLLARDRRERLAQAADLVRDGALLDEALASGTLASGTVASVGSDASDAATLGDDADRPRAATTSPRGRRGRAATDATGDAAAPPRSRLPSPAERRAAILRVVAAWRDLARDLAVASRGGRSELRHVDLLEELEVAGSRVGPAELADFLQRLDRLEGAVEAYANPELALDSLLLAWPRARAA